MMDLLAIKRTTLPMGNRKFGGGGGDGGYSERQTALKADQDEAINAINAVFGKGEGAPIYGMATKYRPIQYTDPESHAVFDTTQQYQEQGVVGYDPVARDKAAADRENLYGTITQDASARLLDKLGKDRDIAQRGTNFQLARQGLAGGSSSIDQGAHLLDQYNEGTLEAGNAALAAGNSARSADEKTRVNLINNIRNGLSQSDALSATYAGLDNNAKEARDAALSTNIGGFFDDINALNQQRQYNQGLLSGKAYSPGAGGFATSGNGGGFNGRTTK